MTTDGLDLMQRRLFVAGRSLDLLVPRDADALLSEEAFEHEEFLPYWAELWPSALALANTRGSAATTLEIGAGLGVPSLARALDGDRVLATDWAGDAVALLEANALRVGARLSVRRWSWTADPAPLGGPFERVLAADVLYERRNVAQLLAALPALVAEDGEAWIADPGRPAAPEFLALAATRWTLDRLEHSGPPTVTVHRLRRASAPSG